MDLMSLAKELVARAEREKDFTDFRSSFEKQPIQSWLTPTEMALHFGVAAYQFDIPNLVEIGTFEGASALFSAAGLRHGGLGKLYSVDPHLGAPPYLGSAPWQFTLEKFKANLNRNGLSSHVTSLVTDSMTAAAMWPSVAIQSVLIDADHSFIGVLKDLEAWGAKLVDGGLILIDDADDPALPELLDFIQMIKEMRTLRFDDLIDGVAVFQRVGDDPWAFKGELNALLASRNIKRPSDMSYVQQMKPISPYNPGCVGENSGLQTAYQLGFLARCGHGDYGVTDDVIPPEFEVIRKLSESRQDGNIVVLTGGDSFTCRMVFTTIDRAESVFKHLLPGGVMVAASRLPDAYESAISEKTKLLHAGLDGCGWSGNIHWGFAKPHELSLDAVIGVINREME
jgi:hypothetical protein